MALPALVLVSPRADAETYGFRPRRFVHPSLGRRGVYEHHCTLAGRHGYYAVTRWNEVLHGLERGLVWSMRADTDAPTIAALEAELNDVDPLGPFEM